jgi:alkylresorcinol/alkylpyrone synthase
LNIAAVGRALPPHFYDQEQLTAALREAWNARHHNPHRLDQIHRNVLVGGRHLALPIEEYAGLDTWGKANDAWIRVAQDVGERAVASALERAGIEPGDVGAFLFTTVTGVATPSIDARLMDRMGINPNARRVPMFGLGCVAGAAGIARAADYVRAWPEQAALLLSVELCSLTLQRNDLSIPNLISSGLFGDGAAAVVVSGDRGPAADLGGPRVLATRSILYRDTQRVMGWDISESGFKIVLSARVPEVARERLPGDVDGFLKDHGLSRSDIQSWVCHPGGPKVLEAIQEGLDLPDSALALSWRSLREVGNLSSTSVLMVLGDTMGEARPEPGALGLLLAMGPGFCSELVLLEW